MVVTKLTKRKRTQPDWLGNDVYPIFDLTKDGDGSGSASVSDFNSGGDGKRSPSMTVASSSFDRGILLGDEEEDSLQFPSPAKKNPSIAMATCVEVQSQPNIELENHVERDAFPVILPVESIQPPTKISGLYLIFTAEAVEVRGGDEESMIYEWPLESIVRIGIHYLSDKEEDTRAFVAITVSVPLCSLSRSSKKIDEYLLQLSNFRDSVVDISKLSPIFEGIIEELRKEDVEKTARTIKMQNSQTSNSLISSSLEEINNVLVYPQGDPDAVTITQKDIIILKPFEFLNDTIIDFYIKYLQQTCVSSEKSKTLHFFNSFFYSKLAEVGGKAAFERVKKWTREKVNVFEKDYVFIPVNHSLHWSLIIICHPGNIWEVPTTDGSFDGDACILHLDSMEGCHRGVDSHIRNYLYQEWIERNRDPKEAPYVEEFFSGMPYIYLKVPQQDNNCDCGLFLLHYVELFLKEAPSVYRMRRQRNPPTEFLRRNWFKPSEASAKRRVILKLILELSQGRSSESVGEYTSRKQDSPDGVDEELKRALTMSLRDEKQHSAEPVDELGSIPSHQVNENCSSDRAEAMEMHVDVNPGDQDEHVKSRHVDARTEASECDDVRRDIHHTSIDQPNSSSKSGADQSSAQISAENDDLNSEPDLVHDAWNNERCPVPRLSLQVKPLQVPTLLDEEVQMFSQPPTVRGIQDASESSDELSSSYFDERSKRSQTERGMSDFDNILSPKQVNSAGSDDEMYESSPKPRWSTSKVQHEVVSPVIGTPENLPSARVRSPELKEDGLTRRKQPKFRNSTPPFGRCSMQSTLNFGPKKEARKESHQQYGSFLVTKEVQEIEELSDDSDFEKMPKTLETEQRVTRSKTQISHGLPLSSEKQAKKDALEALRRKKGSRKR